MFLQRYETRDSVDPGAREAGRNAARAENERELAQLQLDMEQLEQASIEQGMKAVQLEHEREEKQIQEQKRRLRKEQEKQERERKKYEALKFNIEFKEKLLDYTFGTRIGKGVFKHLDVSDMNKVRIALIGPTGSGKSCFIGMLLTTEFESDFFVKSK